MLGSTVSQVASGLFCKGRGLHPIPVHPGRRHGVPPGFWWPHSRAGCVSRAIAPSSGLATCRTVHGAWGQGRLAQSSVPPSPAVLLLAVRRHEKRKKKIWLIYADPSATLIKLTSSPCLTLYSFLLHPLQDRSPMLPSWCRRAHRAFAQHPAASTPPQGAVAVLRKVRA